MLVGNTCESPSISLRPGMPSHTSLQLHRSVSTCTQIPSSSALTRSPCSTLGVKDSFASYEVKTKYGLPGIYRNAKAKVQ